MREVRTCDFCGDDATALYEPFPPTIPDAPRLLLCDGCHDLLESIVDPLVARIEGGGETLETGFDVEETPESEDAGVSAKNPGVASTVPNTEERTPENQDASDRRKEVSTRVDQPQAGSADTAQAESNPDLDSTPADATAEGVGVSESRDASGRSQIERTRTPHGYRKVMRFLENREFPIDRSDAERLVSEAYDLEIAAVADAIDHAVQYGRLREVDGELKR